jgi:hypothetical protein
MELRLSRRRFPRSVLGSSTAPGLNLRMPSTTAANSKSRLRIPAPRVLGNAQPPQACVAGAMQDSATLYS